MPRKRGQFTGNNIECTCKVHGYNDSFQTVADLRGGDGGDRPPPPKAGEKNKKREKRKREKEKREKKEK